jgi:thioesterase domain-containing protein
MDKFKLESFLHAQIPLAASMGLKVSELTSQKVIVWAPLELNRNHLGTAFGGSLQSLLIFSCYTWLFNYLSDSGPCHVLIQEARTRYLLPVKEDMHVLCNAPDEDIIAKFMNQYERKGRARITLRANVVITDGEACTFEGEFIAEKSKESRID